MSPFGVVCAVCGAGMPAGARFCGKCGAAIDAAGSAPARKEEKTPGPAATGVRVLLIAWGLGLAGGFMLGRAVAPEQWFDRFADRSGAVEEGEGAASLLAQARAASDAGRYSTAKDLYQRAIALEPTNLSAHVDLGIAQLALGEETAARGSFRAALIGGAPHPAAAYNLARLEEDAGDVANARRHYELYLDLDSSGRRAGEARARLAALGSAAGGAPKAPPAGGSGP